MPEASIFAVSRLPSAGSFAGTTSSFGGAARVVCIVGKGALAVASFFVQPATSASVIAAVRADIERVRDRAVLQILSALQVALQVLQIEGVIMVEECLALNISVRAARP